MGPFWPLDEAGASPKLGIVGDGIEDKPPLTWPPDPFPIYQHLYNTIHENVRPCVIGERRKRRDEEGNSGVGAGDRDDGNESEPCAEGTTPGLAMPLSRRRKLRGDGHGHGSNVGFSSGRGGCCHDGRLLLYQLAM